MRTVLCLGLIAALPSPLLAGGNEDASAKAPFASPRYSGEGRIAFTSNNVQLLGWKPLAEFNASTASGNDCWGYTSPSGREYAILGLDNGTGFVEITDPGTPEIVGFIGGVVSLWRCIKVYGNYAYAGSEGGGNVQIFNLTNIDSGSVTLVGSVGGTCTSATHTLAVDTTSGFLYRAGGGGTCGGVPQGLQIYSLANPAAPVLVGQWNTGRYVHEAQVETWDVAGPHFGKQIALCFSETSSGGGDPRLTILDVTNKAAIVQLSSIPYTGGAFSHQGWTSANKQHLYLNDELDDGTFGGARTRIFSIANLAAPSYLGFFSAGAPSIDHNLYVKGNRIFEGNYRSGLRVFDNTVPTAPTLIGFFDTYPEDDAQEFNSLWSNYPFFASGTVIGGDIEKGLFVWRVGPPKLTFSFPNGNPELVGPTGSVIHFEIDQNLAGDLEGGSELFHYSTGGPFTSVAATWLGGNNYEATLPALACGVEIQYYVSARSNDGVTWTDPPAGPTQAYQAIAATQEIPIFSETFEAANAGWQVNVAADLTGFSTAATGTWTRANPIGTAAQPEDDHTNPGVNCWFTGQGVVGGGVGDADVDGGATSLRSAVLNASGLIDPHVTYWRWYSNIQGGNPGTNTMTVDISNNGGTSWVLLETVGPTGPDTVGGWIKKNARVADFVAPTNNMRLRFRASDLTGAVVEAAIDDLAIIDYNCATLTATSISQSSGPFRGGNVVTITGTNFRVGETTVRFGFNAATAVTVLNSTTLQATVPPAPGANFGKARPVATTVDVVVQNPGTDTLSGAYTYAPPPQKTL
jgi:choice-of-anchor B domain-containing protein